MKHIETLLAHSGCEPDSDTGAIVSPLYLSTTFERAPDGSYPHGFIYSRNDNPGRRLFEETLASLEGGTACAAFSSGMAASMAVLLALRPGDHIILADDVYYGLRRLLDQVFANWKLIYTSVDLADIDALEAAFQTRTRLVWAESPSNPMLKITDLRAVARATHAAGASFIVDNTWATPFNQRPFELGADMILHSVTKYLSGHADVLGGALVTKEQDDLFERIRNVQRSGGPVLDPFSAWLSLRGMRSLSARMRLHSENALRVAGYLHGHPRVARVHYPGLPDHPRYDVAKGQMNEFGGMMSFEVAGNRDEAMNVAARTKIFTRATSLGSTESLIEHRASIETPPTRTPDNLLRLSVGLEHIDDLLADLSQALEY